MVQGYRGVNINTRDNEESLGEMHMKDYYIDISNQENTAPVYFQCRWSILDVVLWEDISISLE